MKALKEKRVSLRSLMRRGLVILSVLALAFALASCSSSSDSGDGGDTGPTNGGTQPTTPPVAPAKYVERIEVLKHPNTYSYEAAAPDISGLQVAVYWNESGGTSVEIINVTDMADANAKKFFVDPPVAWVEAAGTNVTTFSAKGQYHIQYDDEGALISKPVDLYIPAVRALKETDANIKMDGNVKAVYEDLPIDASAIKLTANYVEIPGGWGWKKSDGSGDYRDVYTAGTGTVFTERYDDLDMTIANQNDWTMVARLTGRGRDDFAWAGSVEGIQSVPVSYSRTVWELYKDQSDPIGSSTLKYWPLNYPLLDEKWPVGSEVTTDSKFGKLGQFVPDGANVGAFYFVEKLEYASGVENLRPFIADEERINAPVNWVKEFVDAKIRFNVIYYTYPGQDLAEAKREIGMNEYIKAMYQDVDEDGNPRATKPKVMGGGDRRGVRASDDFSGTYGPEVECWVPGTGGSNNPTPKSKDAKYISNSILGAAIDDFLDDAVVQCFYYYPGIKRGPDGLGWYDPKEEAGEGSSDDITTSGRTWANAASVPLAGKIFTFDHIEQVRKPNTEGIGNPQVMVEKTYPSELLEALKRRWDVVYVYVDPTPGSTKTMKSEPIDWREVPNSGGLGAFQPEWHPTGIDPGDVEEVSVRFDQPWSDWGYDELDFNYDVLP